MDEAEAAVLAAKLRGAGLVVTAPRVAVLAARRRVRTVPWRKSRLWRGGASAGCRPGRCTTFSGYSRRRDS
jgi:hypothetical protein